jgi:hypothetical protein
MSRDRVDSLDDDPDLARVTALIPLINESESIDINFTLLIDNLHFLQTAKSGPSKVVLF